MSRFECRISSVGRRGILIIDERGQEIVARMAGKLYHTEKPVAGDRVIAVYDGDIPLIEKILPRKSVLQRTAPAGRTAKIIAANVDRVLVISSLKDPDFNRGFVNRALAGSTWRKLPASIVLNKMDLFERNKVSEVLEGIRAIFGKGSANYPIFPVSCISGTGTDDLRRHIEGDTVVMTGLSGTGKTSLAKYFNPGLDLKVGGLNVKTSKGRHTTVAARLVTLNATTTLIDTPGLRMFSIEHISKEDLQLCFPEFGPYLGKCRFRDCIHMTEPGCAVKAAVESGEVNQIRYDTYASFVGESQG